MLLLISNVCQRLHINVAVFLVLCCVGHYSCNNHTVESFSSRLGLGAIHRGRYVIPSQNEANRIEKLTNKRFYVVSQQIVGYSVHNILMVHQFRCNVQAFVLDADTALITFE